MTFLAKGKEIANLKFQIRNFNFASFQKANQKVNHFFDLMEFGFNLTHTAWKVSVFGVILVRILPHSDQTQRDTTYQYSFPYFQVANSY